MILVDSHCHLHMLNLDKYAGKLAPIIDNATAAGVKYILCVCVKLQELPQLLAIVEQFPNVYASVGLHPSEKVTQEPTVDDIVTAAAHAKVVAIGETGLDYYYNDSGLDIMRERFRRHIRAALEVNKPLIIHSRSAQEDTLTIMREEQAAKIKGVMHCFTESLQMAEAAMQMGFYVSFSGIVTFKNAKNVAEVAKAVPLQRLLIETDAPYLTPVPYRGKPNEPQYVRYVAEHIADLHQISLQQVAQQTTANFFELFSGANP